ncbi:unnamed protein product [Chrysodeixis includens]|uniref:Uncharacterized protein n=1 Tax=Chrysodeixis includens TaxID=689277 RepID=A0A9N8Q278_CHRIL|nr:unnamed protein product [Chrysodeixis includens]
MGVSPFLKQVYVLIAALLAAVSLGSTLGYPGVLLLHLMSDDSTIKTDYETLSWIETKNRTLQEIEDYYNYGDFVSRNVDDVEVELPIIRDKNND